MQMTPVMSVFRRRAPPPPMTYEYAVCKGQTLWARVEDTFAGPVPAGPQVTDDDFNDGLTDSPQVICRGLLPMILTDHWDNAFTSFNRKFLEQGYVY